MNITVVIAQALGIVFSVLGLSILVNKKGLVSFIEESGQSRGMVWFSGISALMIGAIIVALNNIWSSGLQLFITIIGWIALIKGIFILFFPNLTVLLYEKMNRYGVLIFGGIFTLVIGLILLYNGF
ncbi:MAG: hypothetical protein PHF79_01355 [Candidatus Pacebacteria bacterium]|nr:hypothetical protein [Candidatus Paceibacterota bacterium]